MAESIRVEGLRELARRIAQFPRKIQRRALYSALHRGGVPIRDEARRLAPVLMIPDARRRAGTLARAIRTMSRRPHGRFAAAVGVGVRRLSRAQMRKFKKGAGKSGAANPDDPFYWRFVEFGTSKMGARPFLRPAFESRKFAAAFAAREGLREALEEAVARLGRQGFKARLNVRLEAFLGL